MTMRIGIDVSPLATRRTGVGNYCAHLVKHLAASAPDVELHGFSSGLRAWNPVSEPGLSTGRHLRLPTRALYRLWDWTGLPKADRLLGGVDVFHGVNYVLPPLEHAKGVLTIHDLAFLRHPELCSPRIAGYFAQNIRRFAQQADAIIACSEATRRDISELLAISAERVITIYEGADHRFQPMDRAEATERVRKTWNITGPYFVFVGAIEPRKNLTTLVEAFARVSQELPHHLVLAGGVGWRAEPVFDAIERHGMNARVQRIGYVAHDDLPALYAAAEAMVFPSLYEGFGLPVIEAMACGCPVITADNSSLPEVAGEAGLLVQATDIEALANAMRRLATDAALRDFMRMAGLQQAGRFSWETTARQTLDVYRHVWEEGGVR